MFARIYSKTSFLLDRARFLLADYNVMTRRHFLKILLLSAIFAPFLLLKLKEALQKSIALFFKKLKG
jgi:hypothetical protein